AALARRAPTAGSDDELLADPPMGAPPGGMQGYSAGRRLRWIIGGIVLLLVGGVGWTVKRMRDAAAAERNAPKQPSYTLATDDAGELGERPRQLVWSDGPARLGLSRQQPGVQEIVLPDRRLRLAPGHDVAQLRVEVKDGVTTELKVLVGDIVQLPPEAAPAPR
ncbi:MAG: hypothetical protein IAG13_13390, partial [Deltaproteobacteria bacterium]|nr:hypothetical protein [Nannocystaceae bacterium]